VKLLALDTSSDACTVAAMNNDAIVGRHVEAAREHTRILMPMIREAMGEAGLGFDDLEAVVLGNGPGSFIGMRIAAAVTQGIAFAARLPVVPVSSLAALALQVLDESPGDVAAIAQDAHMQEVYFGLYGRSADGLVEPLAAERLAGQERLGELEALDTTGCIAAGRGWRLYPGLEAANARLITASSERTVPDARYVLRLGKAAFAKGEELDPVAVNPAYLRQKVASVPARKSP
jgi:tRNA threonylcarbamoyladenosine biosynthesis protein TsaB